MGLLHVLLDLLYPPKCPFCGQVLERGEEGWCAPCRGLAPTIDEIAREQYQVKVGKVNVDEQPDLAGRYGVMSIPTAILFKNGEIASTLVGVQPKTALEELI